MITTTEEQTAIDRAFTLAARVLIAREDEEITEDIAIELFTALDRIGALLMPLASFQAQRYAAGLSMGRALMIRGCDDAH